MSSVCFYFQVHQPRRLFQGHVIDVGGADDAKKLEKSIFDDKKNKEIFLKVLNKCYMPTNTIMLEKIDEFRNKKRKFKISYSMPGIFIEQMEKWLIKSGTYRETLAPARQKMEK